MTRPEPDASLSAKRLKALGHNVLVDPVLQTEFLDDVITVPENGFIVTTSRNGVRALGRILSAERRSHVTLFTVGDASAQLALEYGFVHVHCASGSVTELVTLIGNPSLMRREPGTIAYVCGRDRKGGLETKLRAIGWSVHVYERYRAIYSHALSLNTCNAMKKAELDGVLLYSSRSAMAFKSLIIQHGLGAHMSMVAFFCLAKSIQSVFDREDWVRLIVAKQPNEEALFECLASYSNKK